MTNYFDFMKNIKNPFTGAIDAITDPVDEGGINILGAGVNKEFEAMKTAGLLTDQQYKDAVEKADIRSKRSGIIQGLLGFGLQNFDKGYGSAFDPRYLKAGLASAIPAAQKPFDKLSSNVMNIEKLKEFKRTKDKEVSRLAMVEKLRSNINLTDAEREAIDFMSIPELLEAAKEKTYKAPTTGDREFVENGVVMVQAREWDSKNRVWGDTGEPIRKYQVTDPKNPQFHKTETEKDGTVYVQDNLVQGYNLDGSAKLLPMGSPVERRDEFGGGRITRMTPMIVDYGLQNDGFGLGFVPDKDTSFKISQDIAPIIGEIMKREKVNEAVARGIIGKILVSSEAVVDDWGDDSYNPQALINGYEKYKANLPENKVTQPLTDNNNSQVPKKERYTFNRDGVQIPIELQGNRYVFSDTKKPVPAN